MTCAAIGGLDGVGKKQKDLLEKQKKEAAIHAEVRRLEHQVRLAREAEVEIHFQVSFR